MNTLTRIAGGGLAIVLLAIPAAFAEAASLSITSLSPGTTVTAKDSVSFKVSASGLEVQSYQVSDSFPGSTASVNNISGAGNFYWVPTSSDTGVHNLTILATNSSGESASIVQSITVGSAPSLSIGSLTPGSSVMPGTRLSFSVVASGLTNPSFSVGDSFGASTVGNANINASGQFSWTPDISQNGDHTINIYAYDSTGHSASITQAVRVGAGPSLSISRLSPGASVTLGTTTSFTVVPSNFAPTSFGITDSFTGSSVSNNNITAAGVFSWFPQGSDVGVHTLTVKGTVGAFGESTSTTQTITVVGPGGPVQATAQTASSTTSSTTLSALQAQLAALLSQSKAQSGSTNVTASPAAFTGTLRAGMESEEVLRLQKTLSVAGFLSVTPNGYFGPQTTIAVKKFQKAHGLDQLGTVGPATRAALNALPSSSSTVGTTTSTAERYVFKNFMGLGEDSSDGPDVLELQKRLAVLGFFSGVPTGNFGPATEASVMKFQKAHGLPVVGYVGSQTRAALNQ